MPPIIFPCGNAQQRNPEAEHEAQVVKIVAAKAGVDVLSYEVEGLEDAQRAFSEMAKSKPEALQVVDTGVTVGMRWQLSAAALDLGIPLISEGRAFTEAGALVTYGAKLTSALKQGAVYVDKILKGAKAGDLPIVQPTEFELVVNLKSAKAMRFKIPQSILGRADEVIH